jgi:ribosomal protein L23
MGKMNIVITDKTERRFRDAVTRHKGTKKGSISKAVEEAFELWIESYNTAIFQK